MGALHFRNTYKNNKLIVLYCVLAILFLLAGTFFTLIAFVAKYTTLCIVMAIICFGLCGANCFLLCLKNNDYKLKYYFNRKNYKQELEDYLKSISPNNRQLKIIKRNLLDNYLRLGTIKNQAEETYELMADEDKWNIWINNQTNFNYGNADNLEKLSFLMYTLYEACAGGSGFEKFFQTLSYEQPYFTLKEVQQILFRDEFLSKELKNLLAKVIEEFSYDKQDELYAKYEQLENKELFKYEQELFDCCVWLSYNGALLSSCVGIYVNTGDLIISRVFLSKDYKKVFYIYQDENQNIKYSHEIWLNNGFDGEWIAQDNSISIFETEELAFNDFKHLLNGYIELDV